MKLILIFVWFIASCAEDAHVYKNKKETVKAGKVLKTGILRENHSIFFVTGFDLLKHLAIENNVRSIVNSCGEYEVATKFFYDSDNRIEKEETRVILNEIEQSDSTEFTRQDNNIEKITSESSIKNESGEETKTKQILTIEYSNEQQIRKIKVLQTQGESEIETSYDGFIYSESDQLESFVHQTGSVRRMQKYTYDEEGMLLKHTEYDSEIVGPLISQRIYSYSDKGALVKIVLNSESTQEQIKFAYDQEGRLIEDREVKIEYDKSSRPSKYDSCVSFQY